MSRIDPVAGGAASGSGHSAYSPATSAGGSGASGQDERRRSLAWTQVLCELEDEVLVAEQTLAVGRADEIAAEERRTENWMPPRGMGPVPVDLRERAMRLLQHQLAVAEALVERITQSQRQRDVAARMSYGPSRPVAAYVDRAL